MHVRLLKSIKYYCPILTFRNWLPNPVLGIKFYCRLSNARNNPQTTVPGGISTRIKGNIWRNKKFCCFQLQAKIQEVATIYILM